MRLDGMEPMDNVDKWPEGWWSFGIDYSTAAVHVAAVAPREHPKTLTRTFKDKGMNPGQRAHRLGQETRQALSRLADTAPCQHIYVEQPFGNVKPQLQWACGAILAACHEFAIHYEEHIPIWMANPASWKKDVLGSGKAKKELSMTWVAERFPDLSGVPFTQDEADAICIATYGLLKHQGEMIDADTNAT